MIDTGQSAPATSGDPAPPDLTTDPRTADLAALMDKARRFGTLTPADAHRRRRLIGQLRKDYTGPALADFFGRSINLIYRLTPEGAQPQEGAS